MWIPVFTGNPGFPLPEPVRNRFSGNDKTAKIYYAVLNSLEFGVFGFETPNS
jgi:hypothetical protein